LAFGGASGLVAAGSQSGAFLVGPPFVALPGHNAAIQAVAFRADGRLIATGDEDGVIKLWAAGAQ
jgi:hypothetical protein